MSNLKGLSMDCDFSISEFDAFQRDAVLELLVQCIVELSPTQKTVLAMYYHENVEPTEIAACLDLTECAVEQVRVETLELLRTMLRSVSLNFLPTLITIVPMMRVS